ncbi:hypothetical protein PVK06_022281 [Gossypium arboreum]|uniref:Uncharacterized protein n=1 Tax=Gossypium arboreum TaxID=29729 RepID=A0ABR0P7Y4_GOSAR|nr:hypothetical protein PVK06_022281 [Gossypium arboreum]
MAHVSDIKLIRTDTTLDLSQKAEKGMRCLVEARFFYKLLLPSSVCIAMMWDTPIIQQLVLLKSKMKKKIHETVIYPLNLFRIRVCWLFSSQNLFFSP